MIYYIKKLQYIPVRLLLLIMLINIIGIYTLYSSSNEGFLYFPFKQTVSLLIFLILSLSIAVIDLRVIYQYSYIFYFICFTLLILTYFFGYKAMGAARWISIAGIKIQSSEIMKLAVVMFLARYFHDLRNFNVSSLYHIFLPALFCVTPVLLVLKQPDLGTAIVIIFTVMIIIFVMGIKFKYILYAIIPPIIFSPLLWSILYDYQKKRILTFLYPESDPFGAGYNIIQSKIAIGSGRLLGKGYLGATQSYLNFLPEHHTDFIFACFAEEYGLIGTLSILVIYFLIILETFIISINARSVFGKILVIGISSIFFLHIIINIGMTLGLLPVVGIPLPFFSYGRTMLGMMLMAFGLVMNVNIHRKDNFIR